MEGASSDSASLASVSGSASERGDGCVGVVVIVDEESAVSSADCSLVGDTAS